MDEMNGSPAAEGSALPDGGALDADAQAGEQEYNNALFEGIRALGEEEWEKAVRCFERAKGFASGYSAAEDLWATAERVRALVREDERAIEEAFAAGRRLTALRRARELDRYLTGLRSRMRFIRWKPPRPVFKW